MTGEELCHTRLIGNRALKHMIAGTNFDQLGPVPVNLSTLAEPDVW